MDLILENCSQKHQEKILIRISELYPNNLKSII